MAASAMLWLSGSTVGAWPAADGAVSVWTGSNAFNNSGAGGMSESLAVDGAGNIYMTGKFSSTVDFDLGPGTTPLSSGCNVGGFVLRLDSSGNLGWAGRFGGSTCQAHPHSIAVDGSGNVYTTGSFLLTVDFDPGTGVTNLVSECGSKWSGFISKLNSSGDSVWANSWVPNLTCGGYIVGNSVAVDGSGNVYAVGSFESTVDFDPGSGVTNLTSSSWGSDDSPFIIKLNS